MRTKYISNEATITVKTIVNGDEVFLEATAPSIQIDSEVNYEEVNFVLDSPKLFRDSTTTTLNANLNDGWKYTIRKTLGQEVRRTASVLASDRTVEAFEAARVAVGAPKKAKIRAGGIEYGLGRELVVEDLDAPSPIMVEFVWKEKV